MGQGKLWVIARNSGVLLAVTLVIVVVLAAMPSHRGRSGPDTRPRQGDMFASSMWTGQDKDGHTGHQMVGHKMDGHRDDRGMTGMDHDGHQENVAAAVASMSGGHRHSLHMKMTAIRPPFPGDEERAERVVNALRTSLEKYKDYNAALADGYKPFLPNLPQKEYHFTKRWNGFLEALTFDPARPTSLLYKKTTDGYQLSGAMFTMPKNAAEDQLDARVPLSVASWHLHTNLCMPAKGKERSSDWTKFGLEGSIATEESCRAEGGRFFPSIFGWMVHVYPYQDSKEKIFAHM